MDKLRIMSVFGTRPEAIKMCPLVQELASRPEIESLCCVTAQHRQMLDSVLEVFEMTPDYDLDIMTPRQTLSTITSKCLLGMDEAIEALKPDYIAGLTLLGGEPMEPDNQRALVPFLRRVSASFPDGGKTLWVYTGCTLEELQDEGSRWRTEVTGEFLAMTDVLVDGPFVEELKDISLRFRGSSNQRIIRLR